jgi:hypothetical protein
MNLMNFITKELECESRSQTSLTSCFEHILQVVLDQQTPPPNVQIKVDVISRKFKVFEHIWNLCPIRVD